eukprot:9466694-Pyramimonas_sp.AAC.1
MAGGEGGDSAQQPRTAASGTSGGVSPGGAAAACADAAAAEAKAKEAQALKEKQITDEAKRLSEAKFLAEAQKLNGKSNGKGFAAPSSGASSRLAGAAPRAPEPLDEAAGEHSR